MRRTIIILAAIPLVMVSLVGCSPSPAVVYQGGAPSGGTVVGSSGIVVSQQNVGLWVNGLGKTTGTPDIVVLTLGVESQQKTVAQAQKDAIDAMSSIMQVLKDSGIAEKDIQTSQYNIQQITKWDENQDTYVVVGYRVTNTVTCKIRDITKAGSIIDKTVVAGGDLIRINGISFTVDDPMPYYKIAREKAVQYAMEKARQIAQASGTRLGKVLYISEDTSYIPPMVGNYAMKYAGLDAAAAAPTPISAGELEFQVTITMVYEIN
jgi:uncharacterized protein YggE